MQPLTLSLSLKGRGDPSNFFLIPSPLEGEGYRVPSKYYFDGGPRRGVL
jgi:hypothetical protein